jgi:hypothetical protein
MDAEIPEEKDNTEFETDGLLDGIADAMEGTTSDSSSDCEEYEVEITIDLTGTTRLERDEANESGSDDG